MTLPITVTKVFGSSLSITFPARVKHSIQKRKFYTVLYPDMKTSSTHWPKIGFVQTLTSKMIGTIIICPCISPTTLGVYWYLQTNVQSACKKYYTQKIGLLIRCL
jgi:hypothetical protein